MTSNDSNLCFDKKGRQFSPVSASFSQFSSTLGHQALELDPSQSTARLARVGGHGKWSFPMQMGSERPMPHQKTQEPIWESEGTSDAIHHIHRFWMILEFEFV